MSPSYQERDTRQQRDNRPRQGGAPSGGNPPPARPAIDVPVIVEHGVSLEMTQQAEAWGKHLVGVGLTTAQIRNIFGTVREIEMTWQPDARPEEVAKAKRQLLMLKPKLAYQAAREQKGTGVKELAFVLSQAIDLVGDSRERFQNFVDLFEAILAYHTAHGGRNQ